MGLIITAWSSPACYWPIVFNEILVLTRPGQASSPCRILVLLQMFITGKLSQTWVEKLCQQKFVSSSASTGTFVVVYAFSYGPT